MEPPAEHSQENPGNMCKTCNNSFKTAYALKVHQMVHSTNIICEACGSRFTQFLLFECHFQQSHQTYHFPCELCPAKFESFTKLLNHANNHDKYSCKHCDKKYSSRLALFRHNRQHEENELTCKTCNKSSKTQFELKSHKLTHLNINLYTCNYCGKKYRSETNLRNHKYTEHTVVYTTCEICNKKCDSRSELKIHSYTHYKTYFQCSVCPDVYFQTKQVCLSHIRFKHNSEGNVIEHTGDGKASSEPQVHEELHSRPGSSSSTESTTRLELKSHELTHLVNINLYTCNYCGKTSRSEAHLRTHKYNEHKDVYTTCEICNKKCDSRSELKIHSYTHLKTYFECSVCPGAYFKRKPKCQIHIRRKHKPEDYVIEHTGDGKASSEPQVHEEQSHQDPSSSKSSDIFVTPTLDTDQSQLSELPYPSHPHVGVGLASFEPQIHEDSRPGPSSYTQCTDTYETLDIDTDDKFFDLPNVENVPYLLEDIQCTIGDPHVEVDLASFEPQIHEELQLRPGPSSYTQSLDTFVTPTFDTDQSQLSELPYPSQPHVGVGLASFEPQIHEELESHQVPSSYTKSTDRFEIFILDIIQFLISEIPNLSEDICEELLAIVSELPLYSHTESFTCTLCQKSLTAGDLTIHTNCKLMEEHFTKNEKYFMCNYCGSSFDFLLEAFHHIEGHCVEYLLQTNEL